MGILKKMFSSAKKGVVGSPSDSAEFDKEEIYLYSENDMDALETHIDKHFGNIENVIHEIFSPDIHLDIAICRPTEDRPYYSLITMGMGAYPMDAPEEDLKRAELMINLPPEWELENEDEKWYWPIRWLKILARFPIMEKTWLGWGHSVPAGVVVSENANFSGFVLLDPMAADDECKSFSLPDGSNLNIYQLLPITEGELEYKIKSDTTQLIDMLMKKNDFNSLKILDITRPDKKD